jgi:hypothetical protein
MVRKSDKSHKYLNLINIQQTEYCFHRFSQMLIYVKTMTGNLIVILS